MSRHLQHIYVQRYGGLSECEVGPFEPGLNVVCGPNEAGKSTLASFVGGVLFGWEEAHGVRNRYAPDDGAERAGSLTWADAESGETGVLHRDERGVSGDELLVADIDRATYDAMFSLSADELNALRSSTGVVARLLTAESGTETSPSQAFVEVEQRIATLTAPAVPNSVFALQDQLESKRDEIRAATDRTALLIQEDRELHELKASRAATAERIEELNEQLEDLSAWRAQARDIDERLERCAVDREKLQDELDGFMQSRTTDTALDKRLLALNSTAERVLRDRLDELADQREKLDRIVDTAKENSSTSTAAYEALAELNDEDAAPSRTWRSRSSQAVVSVLLPVVFIAVGVPLFVHARQINSLSITALAAGLIVMAMFLAAAAFVMLFRPSRDGDTLEARRQDAQWVMLQDRKKLDSCLAERAQLDDRVKELFERTGLAAADGSIRQARSLLDEARDVRARAAEADQRVSSLQLRLRAVDKECAELNAARARIAQSAELPEDALARQLDGLIRTQGSQRDALLQAADDMGQRFGELSRELQLARDDRTLDQLKLDYHQIRTRLREAKSELISLLLAKRMLERSIMEWERLGQPEVYEHAGRLLSMITDGRWVKISTSTTGSLVAVAADGTQRDPRHLSLGTCQQVYLALRVALLISASDVGRAIPVLADDILVNFDADRRRGAARVLAELARYRQVIVFTCHEETAAALETAARIDLPRQGSLV